MPRTTAARTSWPRHEVPRRRICPHHLPVRPLRLWFLGFLLLAAGVWLILRQADAEHSDEFWSLAVPGALTGVGTLALAASTVVLAYQDRRRDDRLRAIDRHRSEQREHDRALREQAELISAWVSRYASDDYQNNVQTQSVISLSNGSPQVVYEVVVFQVFTQGGLEGPGSGAEWAVNHAYKDLYAEQRSHVVIGALPPSRSFVVMPFLYDPSGGRLGAEIAFTDRSGHHWMRSAEGELHRLDRRPVDHYGLPRPVNYVAAFPGELPLVEEVSRAAAATSDWPDDYQEVMALLQKRQSARPDGQEAGSPGLTSGKGGEESNEGGADPGGRRTGSNDDGSNPVRGC